jgi:hypothetical protein
MNELETLYFEKELRDIKDWCIKHKQTVRYQNQDYYLYCSTIYDKDMNIVIENTTNGFLDLYEYYEYFPQNE